MGRKIQTVIGGFLVLSMLLCSCRQTKVEKENETLEQVEDIEVEKKEVKNAPNIEKNKKLTEKEIKDYLIYDEKEAKYNIKSKLEYPWQKLYYKKIKSERKKYYENVENCYSNYFFYDMNCDELPELFLQRGNCEADTRLDCYTINEERVTFVGTIEAGHSIFYKSEANLIQHMAHMGVANMRRYYFEGDKLASHEFMEEDITGMEIDYTQVTNYYKDAKALRYYSIYLDFPFMLADETPVSTATDLSENEVKQILSYVIDKNAKVHPAKGDTDPYLNTYISFNEFVEFGTSFTKNTMKEQQWIDLNGDGQIECLLRWEDESQGNSYIILSLQDHTVYAYQLYQMFDGKFKEDGSFANGTMTSRFIFDKTQLYQMYE